MSNRDVGGEQSNGLDLGAEQSLFQPLFSVSGFSQRAFGAPSFNQLRLSGFTQRAFGAVSLSLSLSGFTRRAFGTPSVNLPVQGFTRRAFGTAQVIAGLFPAGFTQRAFGTPRFSARTLVTPVLADKLQAIVPAEIPWTSGDPINGNLTPSTGYEVLLAWNSDPVISYQITLYDANGFTFIRILEPGEFYRIGTPIQSFGWAQRDGHIWFDADNSAVKFAAIRIASGRIIP